MKSEYTHKMYDLIEMFGEQSLLLEWITYADVDELKEFVEHVEDFYEVEV